MHFSASRPLALLDGRCRLLRLVRVGSGLALAWLTLPAARTNAAEQGYPVRPAPTASSVVANLAPATPTGLAEPGRCPTATMAQGRRSVAGARLRYPLSRWAGEISPFGWRYSSARGAWSLHSGIDLISPPGTPVLAVMAGQLGWVGRSGSASTDHLHLELRSGIGPSQVAVDPARYLPRP